MTREFRTATRAATIGRPARSVGAILRGLGALLLLLTLIVVPPAALVALVGNPIPDQIIIGGQFTNAAIIGLLAVVVWAAWAQLMYVIAVETVAAVRGVGLPRSVLFAGPQQQLARRLVSTVLVVLATTTAVTTAQALAGAGHTTATASAPVAPDRPVVNDEPAPPPAPRTTSPTAAPTAAVAAEELKLYVVQPPRGHYHDNLWDIAERHLGDGLRWKEIFHLNHHRPQPDGRRLELARLIQPGWRLLMPADAVGLPTAKRPAADDDEATAGHDRQRAESSPPVTEPCDEAAPPAPGSPATASPQPSSALANAGQDDSTRQTDDVQPDQDVDSDQPVATIGQLVLGLGIATAAGLIAELERRRRRRQRHRQPGERLTQAAAEAARTEQVLRAADRTITIQTLDHALRQLAAECRQRTRGLPDMQVIRLSDSSVELHLGADEPDAVPPFATSGPRNWQLADTPAEPDPDVATPYPALLTIGVTDDAVVIVNLEAAGTLQIVGHAHETTPILQALVAELGTSPLTTAISGSMAGLATEVGQIVDRARLRVLPAGHDAASWATTRLKNVAKVLAAAGARDVVEARARDLAGDVWVPEVLVLGPGHPIDPPVTVPPYSGLCVITTNEEPDQRDRWQLTQREAGRWRLDPLGFDVDPQRMDAALLEQVRDLLDVRTWLSTDDRANQDGEPQQHMAGASPELARIAAALPTADQPASQPVVRAPRVLVLGRVEVNGPNDGEPGRGGRAIELIAYLALHPSATQHQLDEALWPGKRISRTTRNPLVSRARDRLGKTPDGEPYLPLFTEGGDYGLRPDVTCDWHDFLRLARQGLARGSDGAGDLARALELVRGRPFLGIDPAFYAWAEADTQEMISTVVDVAHALAQHRTATGDYRQARWAAAKGLLADPCSELLYRDAIRAASLAGDTDDAERLAAGLRRQIEATDPDAGLEDETVELLVTATLRGSK